MGLYRLLSNKADVVKGFAKRCNEQWEVARKHTVIGRHLLAGRVHLHDHLVDLIDLIFNSLDPGEWENAARRSWDCIDFSATRPM
jgi:Mg2+ and Co2+ transporter CorA